LAQIAPYKTINKLLEQETFEPVFSWGLRMAFAAIIPVIWGSATNHVADASWMTLTAECICWVELKGSFGQRLRILLGGIFLTLAFTLLGSVTGNNIWISVISMLAVGFISGLFKNLGDRGSGLAICVYVVFIITNAYPTQDSKGLEHRMLLVLIGGTWNALVGIAAALFTPARQPYRRSVAVIWRNISDLIEVIAKGWEGTEVRSSLRDIYLKEKSVRTAIDSSLALYETMAHQVTAKDKHEYQLAQTRKATSLVAAHIITISEELERLNIQEADNSLKLKIYAILKAMQKLSERMASFMIVLKPEEELLVISRINRLANLTSLLKEYNTNDDSKFAEPAKRIVHLSERVIKLALSAVNNLKEMEKDHSVFRSYSLVRTMFIIHPKHWIRNVKLLFNFNTFTTRYAMRSAIASTIALFIFKWFKIDHGYWLPFTVIIVLQPYFGATLTKAFDRMIGTITGGIAGGILLITPMRLYLNEIILFISYLMMVYFLRRRYSVAVFFITISVVLLFDVEDSLNPMLILTRALATAGGATLAIVAGFALLPHWDAKWLPSYLADAICSNYSYFVATYFSDMPVTNWTRLKRSAETKNSNAFDSFNRYMQEPRAKRKQFGPYYQLIMHNVRVTRELNNVYLEQENATTTGESDLQFQNSKLTELLYWFNANMELVKKINTENTTQLVENGTSPYFNQPLSSLQQLYLDRMLIELKAVHSDLLKLANNETE